VEDAEYREVLGDSEDDYEACLMSTSTLTVSYNKGYCCGCCACYYKEPIFRLDSDTTKGLLMIKCREPIKEKKYAFTMDIYLGTKIVQTVTASGVDNLLPNTEAPAEIIPPGQSIDRGDGQPVSFRLEGKAPDECCPNNYYSLYSATAFRENGDNTMLVAFKDLNQRIRCRSRLDCFLGIITSGVIPVLCAMCWAPPPVILGFEGGENGGAGYDVKVHTACYDCCVLRSDPFGGQHEVGRLPDGLKINFGMASLTKRRDMVAMLAYHIGYQLSVVIPFHGG